MATVPSGVTAQHSQPLALGRPRSSNGAVLTEYRGLTVAQLRQLRTTLGDDVNYAVVKNTLTSIAAKQAGVDVVRDVPGVGANLLDHLAMEERFDGGLSPTLSN